MILWELFRTFFLIGFVSFGGGYAMIPIIEKEASQNNWMTTQQIADMIAIAGMSPGPIATNSAILIGYTAAGLPGALVSTLGTLLPSILLVITVATFFSKLQHYPIVQSIFYGLRPMVVSLIVFAALTLGISNNLFTINMTWKTVGLLCIFGSSLFLLMKVRLHPLLVILFSGILGVALYP